MKFKTIIEENDTKEIVNSKFIDWDSLKNKSILITGATGLIGSQIVLSLLFANEVLNTNIKILAMVRNKKKADTVFKDVKTSKLKFICQNIEEKIKTREIVDYIIHTANTTSSKEMTEKPVETINSIVEGTKNVLEFSKQKDVKSIAYLSSMEVYGDIPLSKEESLKENDYGYIDILKSRSSYPMGKRIAESLCVFYYKEYGVPVKIARLAQTIGAGVDYNDGRVFVEFARCVTEKKDIILKTKGETTRSYIYITDAITAILSMLTKGQNGESYNIANSLATYSIKEIADMLCAQYTFIGLKIEESHNSFYPNTTKYFLNTQKYESISNWKAYVSLEESFLRLINSFEIKKANK